VTGRRFNSPENEIVSQVVFEFVNLGRSMVVKDTWSEQGAKRETDHYMHKASWSTAFAHPIIWSSTFDSTSDLELGESAQFDVGTVLINLVNQVDV
jgi:hypothetical protein